MVLLFGWRVCKLPDMGDHPRQRLGIDQRIDAQPNTRRQLDPDPACRLSDCRPGQQQNHRLSCNLHLRKHEHRRSGRPDEHPRHSLSPPRVKLAAADLVLLHRIAHRAVRPKKASRRIESFCSTVQRRRPETRATTSIRPLIRPVI